MTERTSILRHHQPSLFIPKNEPTTWMAWLHQGILAVVVVLELVRRLLTSVHLVAINSAPFRLTVSLTAVLDLVLRRHCQEESIYFINDTFTILTDFTSFKQGQAILVTFLVGRRNNQAVQCLCLGYAMVQRHLGWFSSLKRLALHIFCLVIHSLIALIYDLLYISKEVSAHLHQFLQSM